MPLEDMSTRADCKFCVRRPMRPHEVAAGYESLAAELRRAGHDHLAYGIIEIRA